MEHTTGPRACISDMMAASLRAVGLDSPTLPYADSCDGAEHNCGQPCAKHFLPAGWRTWCEGKSQHVAWLVSHDSKPYGMLGQWCEKTPWAMALLEGSSTQLHS
jgi:hypothetical protein